MKNIKEFEKKKKNTELYFCLFLSHWINHTQYECSQKKKKKKKY